MKKPPEPDINPYVRKWDHVTHGQWMAGIIANQSCPDPDATQRIAEYFNERMRDGEPYGTDLLELFMRPVIAALAEGGSADVGMGLKQEKGKYRRENTVNDKMAATAIVTVLRRRGLSKEDAMIDAGEYLDIDVSTVARAVKAYSMMHEWPDPVLEDLSIYFPFSKHNPRAKSSSS